MKKLLTRLGSNPVLTREVVERMRSPRASVLLVIFLGLLAAILYITYRMIVVTASNIGFGQALTLPIVGRTMFEVLLLFLVISVALVTPGTSAGAISGERERRTLHLLQITLLSPRSIVLGKLGASVGFILLLVVASAPLFAIPLAMGGLTVWQVLRGLIVVAVLTIFLASMALYVSSLSRRTQLATVSSYGLTFALMLGTVMLFGLEMFARFEAFGSDVGRPISVYLNPVIAVADAVGSPEGANFASPLSGIASGLQALDREVQQDQFIEQETIQIPPPNVQPLPPLPEQPLTDPTAPGTTVDAAPPPPVKAPARARAAIRAVGPRGAPVSETITFEGPADPMTITESNTEALSYALRAWVSSGSMCLDMTAGSHATSSCGESSSSLYARALTLDSGKVLVYGNAPRHATAVRTKRGERTETIEPAGFNVDFFVVQADAENQAIVAMSGEEEIGAVTAFVDEPVPQPIPPQIDGPQNPFLPQRRTLHIWPVHVGLLLAFSILFLNLAANRLRAPVPRFTLARAKDAS